MDYTREPIIETVITPKEGCKLVVRSSKSAGQEEYFVDAVEVVSFGNSLFFRSIERPKSFLVPATDYEVLEVREARMVLKNVGIDKKIKIGGGRESGNGGASVKESHPEQVAPAPEPTLQAPVEGAESADSKTGRLDKRRDKRRNNRRRRGGTPGEAGSEESGEGADKDEASESENAGASSEKSEKSEPAQGAVAVPFFSALLPPPPTLISETIARYRDNAMFKDAFFIKEEDAIEEISEEVVLPASALDKEPDHSEDLLEALEMQKVILEPSSFGSFEHFEEEDQLNKSEEQNDLKVSQDDMETSSPDYTK